MKYLPPNAPEAINDIQHKPRNHRDGHRECERLVITSRLHRIINRHRAVCVFPGMFPAIMIVTPKSPSARANASAVAASTPLEANGNVTRKKISRLFNPSVRAAASRSYSLLQMLPANSSSRAAVRESSPR